MLGDKESLREYIYTDERRINSYFEQFSAPVTYDKVPTFKIGLQLSGPLAEGTQTRAGRPFTLHEKLTALTQYLEKNCFLNSERPFRLPDHDAKRPFVLESTSMARFYIPAKANTRFAGLHLWVERPYVESRDGETMRLILIEDGPRSDDHGIRSTNSGRSALYVLMDEVGKEIRRTVLFEPFQQGNTTSKNPLKERTQATRRIEFDFARNPATFLERLGADIGPEREIVSLYRIRDLSPFALLGYPIYIAT